MLKSKIEKMVEYLVAFRDKNNHDSLEEIYFGVISRSSRKNRKS